MKKSKKKKRNPYECFHEVRKVPSRKKKNPARSKKLTRKQRSSINKAKFRASKK